MQAVEDDREIVAIKTHELRPSFAVVRAKDGSRVEVRNFDVELHDRWTSLVSVHRDDVPGLIAALQRCAPEVGRTCASTVNGAPADDRPRTADLSEPLRAFELGLCGVLHDIGTKLLLEGNARQQDPTTLVDDVLDTIRPRLRQTFNDLAKALTPPTSR